MEAIWYIVNIEGIVVRPTDGRYLMVVRGAGESYMPGALSFPGGKVEGVENEDNVLEETLRREIREETGVEVADEMVYVESHSFVAEGDPVVDVVFLCRYQSGKAIAADPDEVAEVHWMTAREILDRPETPPWTCQSIELAEEKRAEKGW
ncbi:MAG: NUDIX hydrolase [Chloroflexi bacterium]|nr:NUDIX hydrolase [Chloroflexota bacterium]